MKKTQKPSFAEVPATGGGIIMDAANLRRDPAEADVWRRAGKPRKVFSLGVLPFLRFSPFGDSREIELSTDGENNLYGRILHSDTTSPYPLSPNPQKLAHLDGEPILAVTSARGIIRLMLRHAPDCFLTYTDSLQLTFEGAMPALPAIVLEARDSTVYYASTGPVALTGGNTGLSGSKLCEADAGRVKTALLGAYKSVGEQARRNGDRIQPVTARCRLTDAAGNTVALGEKIPLGCSATIPTSKVPLTSSDGMQTLASGSLEARSYNPVLVVPERLPYPWNMIVDRLVVEITEEMEPVDASAPLPHGIQRNAASGVTTVTAQLPGLEIEELFTRARYDALAAAQLKEPMYRCVSFDLPFGGGITLNGSPLAPGSRLPLQVALPDGCETAPEGTGGRGATTYSAALDAGEFTILCNPRDGEGVFRPGVAEVVRSGDLGEIVSRFRVGEGEIVKVAPLPRSGSGWDFSRLKLLMFGPEGTRMVTLNGRGEFHSVTAIDRRAVGSSRAVCEATGSSGAVLLALAAGDVIEISGQKVTTLWHPGLLPRGREGAESLSGLQAIGWEGVNKEIWLPDGERLWRLCPGGGASATLRRGSNRRSGAGSREYELIRAALPGIEGVGYQPPFRLGSSRGALLLATSAEVRNLSDELPDSLMDIRLRIRRDNPAFCPFPWLKLQIFGSGLLGNYTLRGDHGTEIPEELLKIVVNGDVNAPIPLRLALPRRQWLEESYTFAANADLSIRPSQLLTLNS